LPEVASRALDVEPADAAIHAVDGSERLERDLSDAEQLRLARSLGIELY
jgi:hypothetical protein